VYAATAPLTSMQVCAVTDDARANVLCLCAYAQHMMMMRQPNGMPAYAPVSHPATPMMWPADAHYAHMLAQQAQVCVCVCIGVNHDASFDTRYAQLRPQSAPPMPAFAPMPHLAHAHSTHVPSPTPPHQMSFAAPYGALRAPCGCAA
jgi:hypothetical protein